MPEIVPTSQNINTDSVWADSKEGLTPNQQNMEPTFRGVRSPSSVVYYTGLGVFSDDMEYSSERTILGSIEAKKRQYRGEKLREMIAQDEHGVESAWIAEPYSLYFQNLVEFTERAQRLGRGSSVIASAIFFSAKSASDELRFRLDDRLAESQLHMLHRSWYDQACQDLQDIYIEASEEGFEAPEASTFEYTRNMLKKLSEQYDELPDIQPMEDRSIAICFENREQDSSILFVIESDCAGLLIARIDGSSYRQRVSDVLQVLPFGGYHAMDKAGIRRIQRPIFGI